MLYIDQIYFVIRITNICVDDWYNGMLIPKDSVVWIGIWTMHQDPSLYPEPEKFNPDRFAKHTKLAHEYAVGAEWDNRDTYPIIPD
jgi:cytochrome P450